MNFTLNTDIIHQEGFTIGEFLYLVGVYFDEPMKRDNFSKMVSNSYVGYDSFTDETGPNNIKIATQGARKVEEILFKSDTKDKKISYEIYLSIAAAMQNCYPAGFKITDRGKYPWKDSVGIVAKKLWALKKKYPYLTFSEEEAVDATKRYIQSFGSDTTYMSTIKYFILDDRNGEEKSPFMAYLEEKQKPKNINNDWTTETR